MNLNMVSLWFKRRRFRLLSKFILAPRSYCFIFQLLWSTWDLESTCSRYAKLICSRNLVRLRSGLMVVVFPLFPFRRSGQPISFAEIIFLLCDFPILISVAPLLFLNFLSLLCIIIYLVSVNSHLDIKFLKFLTLY